MKKILLALTILLATQANAQLVKKISGSKEISKRSSTYTLWTEGSFIELNDSLFYIFLSSGHTDYVYVSLIEDDNVIVLDSISSSFTYSTGEPSRFAPVNNYPSAVASGDTIFIATSFEIYKWRNRFINTEHPQKPIMKLSLDDQGKVYACGLKDYYTYVNGNWDSGKYSTSSNLRKIEHLGDTIIFSHLVGVDFLIDDVIYETIPEARRIKKLNGSIFYLNHYDGYIYKRVSKGNYIPFDKTIYNAFYDCLDFEFYNGLLWITAKKFEGDPSFKLYYLKDEEWHQASDIDISYLSNSYNRLYLHGEFCYKLGIYGFVQGYNYFDINENCSLDTKDELISDLIFINNNAVANSPNGKFSILIEAEKNNIVTARSPQASTGFLCRSDTFSIFNVQNDSTYYHNFIHKLDPNISDLELGLSSDVAVRGFYYSGSISITNNNLNTYDSVVVKLLNQDNWSDFYSSFSFTQNGDTMVFTIPAISSFETVRIPFTCIVDANVYNRGDTFCITACLIAPDSLKFNNYDTVCNLVMAAYDPNSKTSFPQGAIKEPVNKIDYTIQFQNLGNYKATTVRVVDTLDSHLPIEYIRIKGTSHPETYSLEVRNNVLIWTFKGINLPDSASDPEGSKGYISYEAKVKSAFLKHGDQIDNKAEIYFDYEKPVITNFASVYLRNESSSIVPFSSKEVVKSLMAYPNPFGSQITIENNANEATILFVYNIQGKLISETKMGALSNCTITLNDYPNGLYLVTNNKGETLKIIKTN